jgi:hypothetical protein
MEPSRAAALSAPAPAPAPATPGVDDKADYLAAPAAPSLASASERPYERPPISYASPRAFAASVRARFVSLWTRRFVLSLLAGQLLSLCITCTNVTTTELVSRNWSLPTTQTFFLCVPRAAHGGGGLMSGQVLFAARGVRSVYDLQVCVPRAV